MPVEKRRDPSVYYPFFYRPFVFGMDLKKNIDPKMAELKYFKLPYLPSKSGVRCEESTIATGMVWYGRDF